MASPIVRDTIKRLRARQAQLRREIKGPLEELRQIEEDLQALGATTAAPARRTRAARRPAAPPGATQRAILRAIRNGATTPEEIAQRTSLAPSSVKRSLTTYASKDRLVTTGPNGLTLTKGGRTRLAELESG